MGADRSIETRSIPGVTGSIPVGRTFSFSFSFFTSYLSFMLPCRAKTASSLCFIYAPLSCQNNCTHLCLFISRFRRKRLRVCRAKIRLTLKKCGGGFEFAIKIIAYHSLSPSFSPLKSIIFLSLAILLFSPSGWSIRARLTNLS